MKSANSLLSVKSVSSVMPKTRASTALAKSPRPQSVLTEIAKSERPETAKIPATISEELLPSSRRPKTETEQIRAQSEIVLSKSMYDQPEQQIRKPPFVINTYQRPSIEKPYRNIVIKPKPPLPEPVELPAEEVKSLSPVKEVTQPSSDEYQIQIPGSIPVYLVLGMTSPQDFQLELSRRKREMRQQVSEKEIPSLPPAAVPEIKTEIPKNVNQQEQQQRSCGRNCQCQTSRSKKDSLKFTSDMLKDQENLIATMRQQGISEDLMVRQFENLLEVQRNQLRYMKEAGPSSPTKFEPMPNRDYYYDEQPSRDTVEQNLPEQAHVFPGTPRNQSIRDRQMPQWQKVKLAQDQLIRLENTRQESPKEPSSLAKIREEQDIFKVQKRNNGLQDVETAQKILEKLKTESPQHQMKLNGVQDPDQTYQMYESRQYLPNQVRQISSNGLENARNPDNPHKPKRTYTPLPEEQSWYEYPRQKIGDGPHFSNYYHPGQYTQHRYSSGGDGQKYLYDSQRDVFVPVHPNHPGRVY